MASEIIRDGVKYSVAHTFKFDKSGNISESHDGGEIFDHEVDAIIRDEALTAENDAEEQELERLEAESNEPIKKSKSKSKSKSFKKGII